MNKKYFIFLSIFFTIIIGSNNCNAQLTEAQKGELLLKIDASIANVKTLVYKIEYTKKYLSSRDSIHTTAVCSLYIAPKDKMKAYSIVDGTFTELNITKYMHRAYDGKKTSWANCLVDSLNNFIKSEIGASSRLNQSVVKNYSSELLTEYLSQKKPLGKYLPSAKNILVKDDIISNTPVYALTLHFGNHDEVEDHVEKHYIRKSDLLPVAFSSFLRWENMEQYNYYEVDYLAINPNITPEDFKIEKDETLNAKERYAAFKEKIKK